MKARIWSRLSLFALCAAGLRAEEPTAFAIRDARVVPVSGPVLEHGTVVIRRGLLMAVGNQALIPSDALVIEGKGLTVYPGFIDALTDVGLQATPAPGAPPAPIAPPRPAPHAQGPEDRPGSTPWVNVADDVKLEDKRLEAWRNAGFTSVLAAPKAGIFPGQGAVLNTGSATRPGDLVLKAPATFHATFQTLNSFPDSLMGNVAYLRQTFLDAQRLAKTEGVLQGNANGTGRASYDRTLRSIAEALQARRPVLMPATTPTQIRRALSVAKEAGITPVLVGVQQAYAAPEMLAQSKASALVSVRWPEVSKDADPKNQDSLRLLRFRDRAPSTPEALRKAGVTFGFYSDGLAAPKDVIKNLGRAIEAGLPREAALRALTLDAASILGVADRVGSVEAGKLANLVITDGDLFDPKTHIKWVFVDGRRFEVRDTGRPTEPPTITLAGEWKLALPQAFGASNCSVTFSMAPDGTLTGSLAVPSGTADLTEGWVSGNKFSFTALVPATHGPIASTFTGTMDGPALKGTASVAGQSHEFTGTRGPASEHP